MCVRCGWLQALLLSHGGSACSRLWTLLPKASRGLAVLTAPPRPGDSQGQPAPGLVARHGQLGPAALLGLSPLEPCAPPPCGRGRPCSSRPPSARSRPCAPGPAPGLVLRPARSIPGRSPCARPRAPLSPAPGPALPAAAPPRLHRSAPRPGAAARLPSRLRSAAPSDVTHSGHGVPPNHFRNCILFCPLMERIQLKMITLGGGSLPHQTDALGGRDHPLPAAPPPSAPRPPRRVTPVRPAWPPLPPLPAGAARAHLSGSPGPGCHLEDSRAGLSRAWGGASALSLGVDTEGRDPRQHAWGHHGEGGGLCRKAWSELLLPRPGAQEYLFKETQDGPGKGRAQERGCLERTMVQK